MNHSLEYERHNYSQHDCQDDQELGYGERFFALRFLSLLLWRIWIDLWILVFLQFLRRWSWNRWNLRSFSFFILIWYFLPGLYWSLFFDFFETVVAMFESSCFVSLQWAFILISFWRSPFLSKLARIFSFLLLLSCLHLNWRKWSCNIFVKFLILLHHLMSPYSLRSWRHLFRSCLYGVKMLFVQIDTKQSLKIVPFYPQYRFSCQALIDQLVQNSIFPDYLYSPLLLEFFAVCAKWMQLVKHFVQDDSNRPNITFDGIRSSFRLAEVHFRSHCVRRSASSAFYLKLLAHELSQPKICQLYLSFLHKNVLKLQVSVQDIPGLQYVHPIDNLLEILEHSLQLEPAVHEFIPQIPITEFENDEAFALMRDDIDYFDNIF